MAVLRVTDAVGEMSYSVRYLGQSGVHVHFQEH
jgi:hypothetical protein